MHRVATRLPPPFWKAPVDLLCVCDGQGCNGKLSLSHKKQVIEVVHEEERDTSHEQLAPHMLHEIQGQARYH